MPRSEIDPLPGTRREFLESSFRAAVAAALVGGTSRASDRPRLPQGSRATSTPANNGTIGIAFVGLGNRGSHLMRSHGYWPDDEMKRAGYAQPPQKPLPKVSVRAVCDVYQHRLDQAVAAAAKYGPPPAAHRDWHRVIDDKSVDAVVIAAPDCWHAPVAIAAIQAGKDVYVEKCMTNTFEEAKALRDLARKSKQIVQVGHQNRFSSYHNIARSLVEKNVLGKVSVVQTSLGRNTRSGAYLEDVPADATRQNISWDLFVPHGPVTGEWKESFTPAALFTWRRFWLFSTGIAGDLLSHEVDAANQILGLGIPDVVSASGGIHVWKDERETPDVYSVVHEYHDRDITLTYNATLGNSLERKTFILGRDASMALGLELLVYPDIASEKYKDQLAAGKMGRETPFIHFEGPTRDPKLTTSPTLAWADGKGLTFTEFGGKSVDVTRLAVEDFHKCIRERRKPLCDVEEGYNVAVACHMGTHAFRSRKTMRYDRAKEEIVAA